MARIPALLSSAGRPAEKKAAHARPDGHKRRDASGDVLVQAGDPLEVWATLQVARADHSRGDDRTGGEQQGVELAKRRPESSEHVLVLGLPLFNIHLPGSGMNRVIMRPRHA